MQIIDLLKDPEYVTSLLTECGIVEKEPVHREWIKKDLSDYVTDAFHKLLPQDMPYLTRVVVERNPDTIINGACVDDNSKRMRYFVVTVIPDTDYPYNYSYPLISALTHVSLFCWEDIRAMLEASRLDMRVLIADNPTPPILNNARIEWVSLYLGKAPYAGITKLSEQWTPAEKFDGEESDVHLVKVREQPDSPVFQRLIDAYEQNYAGKSAE